MGASGMNPQGKSGNRGTACGFLKGVKKAPAEKK